MADFFIMETEQTQESDDDCEMTSPLKIGPPEQESFSSISQQKAQRTNTSQESEASRTKEPEGGNITFDDVDMMVQNYKLIGGQMKFNLKMLETQLRGLQKTLSERIHECEVLNKQKEFQMKILVDLQIKLETLDMERVKLLNETRKDMCEKTEILTHQMQSLLENDDIIGSTAAKFNEFLGSEKFRFKKLLSDAKSSIELHCNAGENHYKELQEFKKTFPKLYEAISKENQSLDQDLKEAADKCQEIIEAEKKIDGEILQADEQIKEYTQKNNELKAKLEQEKNNLSENEHNYENMVGEYDNKLCEVTNQLNEAKKGLGNVLQEIDEKSENLSDVKQENEYLTKEVEEYTIKLENAEEKFASLQQELESLNGEYQMSLTKLDEAKAEEAKLQEIVLRLPGLTEEIQELKQEESDLHSDMGTMEKEIEGYEAIYNELLTKKEELESELAALMLADAETKQKNIESEKEFEENYKSAWEHCETAGMELAERYKEYDQLILEDEQADQELRDLDVQKENLQKDLDETREILKTLIKEEEDFNKEAEELKLFAEEVEKLNQEYGEFVKKNEELEAELTEVEKYLEESPKIKELEDAINQKNAEINDSTLRHEEAIEAINLEHERQMKLLEERSARKLKEIERFKRKEEAHVKKMTTATPEMEEQLKNLEEELVKGLPHIVDEIKSRVGALEEISEFYTTNHKVAVEKGLKADLFTNLTALDEQLSYPMKCMMAKEGIPRIDLNHHDPDSYTMVIRAFKDKYFPLIEDYTSIPPMDMVMKLRDIGGFLFGEEWAKPTSTEQVCESEISSTTIE